VNADAAVGFRASEPARRNSQTPGALSGTGAARLQRRPQVHQVLATLGYGDAIGNQVLGIQRVLRAAGYQSDIFVETAEIQVAPFTRDYRELPDRSDATNVLIHHFSIKSRASRVAYALPDRMILVYHNVTPAHYFLHVNDLLADMCYRARRELAAYAARVQLALGVSEFNREELERAGFTRTAVLPVVPDFSHLDVLPDPVTAETFDDGMTNVLFVGRVIPNKKVEDVIRFFHGYNRLFNPASRLLIVGSWRGFDLYYAMLQEFIAAHGVANVHFTGHVSNQELTAYYDLADVFLCASEHEGFCVPIVESFYKQVPVVAYAATAVPATMDGAGILYDRKDPALVAGCLDSVVRDDRVRERIVEGQDRALARLRARDFRALLLGFVDGVLAGPAPGPVRVVPGFWQQFAHVDRTRLHRR
jgi:glycosyltransferase involved in cell wall biosynthesis